MAQLDDGQLFDPDPTVDDRIEAAHRLLDDTLNRIELSGKRVCDGEPTCAMTTTVEYGLCPSCIEQGHRPLPPLPFSLAESVMTGPQEFRKKPVTIEAWQLTIDNAKDICDWIYGDSRGHTRVSYIASGEVTILTLEGDMTASVGDWIIRGVRGEFYPCKPDIFEATYERVGGGGR